VALLDALAPSRRGRDGFDRDRHQALIRIGEAAAPALGLAAATIIALIDLDQAVERVFRPLAQPVAQLVRHQPGRVVASQPSRRSGTDRAVWTHLIIVATPNLAFSLRFVTSHGCSRQHPT